MPLFYNWNIGIRFEMGCPDMDFEDRLYYAYASIRSKMIFNEIFSNETDIYMIVNEHRSIEHKNLDTRTFDIYKDFLKDKDRCKDVKITEIPYCYQEDDEEQTFRTFRYSLDCKIDDLKTTLLLQTMMLNMGLGAFEYNKFNEIFFINKNRDIIYHLYSHEGLDVVSKERNSIKHLFQRYNNWILDYDRERITKIFNTP